MRLRWIIAVPVLFWSVAMEDCLRSQCPNVPDQPHEGICELYRD